MSDANWLAAQFEEHRGRLVAIAQRMLGSAGEADDAVQEVWIRLNRSDAEAIEHLGSWLSTVLYRVCLNVLQSRRARPEVPVGAELPEPVLDSVSGSDPEQEALIAESIGLALLVVLDRLAPAERVAFVLHDVFAIPFEEIAPIVDRTPAAARKLASRARQRIQRADPPDRPDRLRQATVIDAFLAAARRGDFDALLGVLDPDIVVGADDEAAALGAARERRGAATVAEFLQRAHGATPALVDGVPSAVWMPGGRLRVLFSFTIQDERIVRIDLVADPARLRQLDVVLAATPPPQAGNSPQLTQAPRPASIPPEAATTHKTRFGARQVLRTLYASVLLSAGLRGAAAARGLRAWHRDSVVHESRAKESCALLVPACSPGGESRCAVRWREGLL